MMFAMLATATTVVLAAPATAPAPHRNPRAARRMLGVESASTDTVRFRFTPADFPSATADSTGVEVPIAKLRIRSAGVASPLNGWDASVWPLTRVGDSGVWQGAQPLAGAAPGDTVAFRIVLNGTWWATPAPHARNARVTPAGRDELFFVVPAPADAP